MQPDPVYDDLPAQQREQLCTELRAAPAGQGLGPEARGIAKGSGSGADGQPGEKAELDVPGEDQVASGRLLHPRLDAGLELVGIDDPDEDQQAKHDEQQESGNTQRYPFDDAHAADIVAMSTPRVGHPPGRRSGRHHLSQISMSPESVLARTRGPLSTLRTLRRT